jgi:hypothetical protein
MSLYRISINGADACSRQREVNRRRTHLAKATFLAENDDGPALALRPQAAYRASCERLTRSKSTIPGSIVIFALGS